MGRVRFGWLTILAGLLAGSAVAAETPHSLSAATMAILQDVPDTYRVRVQRVLDRPALCVRGPSEAFHCSPQVYDWLLDHPDRAYKAWVRLGARCLPIMDRGNGRFGCKDGQGSDVHWDTIINGPDVRVWYAEGVVKPSLLLPTVPVRAVIVLRIKEIKDTAGRSAIRHHVELILHTDSKAASLATRIMGASAPRMAEQYLGQVQTFFGALAWYINEHPNHMKELLAE